MATGGTAEIAVTAGIDGLMLRNDANDLVGRQKFAVDRPLLLRGFSSETIIPKGSVQRKRISPLKNDSTQNF